MLLFQWALSQENWDEDFVNARVPRPSYITLVGVESSWRKLSEEFDGCFSQGQFRELFNEGLSVHEKSLSYSFIEGDF